MTYVNSILEFLLANPLFLIPILVLVAMGVYAILKKLSKIYNDLSQALAAAQRVFQIVDATTAVV